MKRKITQSKQMTWFFRIQLRNAKERRNDSRSPKCNWRCLWVHQQLDLRKTAKRPTNLNQNSRPFISSDNLHNTLVRHLRFLTRRTKVRKQWWGSSSWYSHGNDLRGHEKRPSFQTRRWWKRLRKCCFEWIRNWFLNVIKWNSCVI